MTDVLSTLTPPSATDPPDPRQLFRLPWTNADNAMTWLEPTRRCNITCDACFVGNDPASDKPLESIRHELEVMLRLRRCDAMLIAGGEPLVHPQIDDIVALVRDAGVKPIIVTNGVRFDRPLLRALTRAGVRGFTFHVDSHQARPHWRGKSEGELNELRAHFADEVFAVGGLTCAFNTTVFPDTVAQVPDVVRWAVSCPDRVHVLTLICVRMAHPDDPFAYYVGDRQVDFASTPYVSDQAYRHIMTDELFAEVRKVLPDFAFCAYLGGTVQPESLKWVIGCHLTTGERSFGTFGARSIELIQNGHHALRGRYLAFAPPRMNRTGRTALLLALFDPAMRKTARRYLRNAGRRPKDLLRRLHVQTISVVQPVDVLPSGECDTCDGCPNATFWNDRLVPACRAEEYRMFGSPIRLVPLEAPRHAD
jgi:hypothetical protein